MDYIASCWTICTMWLMSEGKYRVGWISSLFSQILWIILALRTGLYGMLILPVVMLFIAGKALYKLGRLQTPAP